MSVPLRIAARYLFNRKSSNVIGRISAVGVIGMAIGTAALILILSVYNGFDSIIRRNLDETDPPWLVVPRTGKYFTVPPGMEDCVQIVSDGVFISFEGKQAVARIEGRSDAASISIGSDLASEIGYSPHFVRPVELFFPKRGVSVSLSNPAASLSSLKVHPSQVFNPSSEGRTFLVVVPAQTARELLGCAPDEVSALACEIKPSSLPEDLKALDRVGQHPSLYKMMRYEKAAVYLILLLVVLIVSFNILASQKMLFLEKEEDRETLSALGMSPSQIRRIFLTEGRLISLLGLVSGTLAGVLLVLAQQKFGIIRMPGNFLVTAYPVILKPLDILLCAAGVALIGELVSSLLQTPRPRGKSLS